MLQTLQSATVLRPIAYSYVRLSSLRQLEGHGIERQVERARKFAEEHNLDLRENTTLMDLGKSGYKGEHLRDGGALRAFLDAVEEGKVAKGSYLIIESLDRFSRQQPAKVMPRLLDLLEAGIIIATLVDPPRVHTYEDYLKDSMNLIYSIVAFQRANDESVHKQDRQLKNWDKKRAQAQAGQIVTGRIPQWLKIVTDDSGRKSFEAIPARVEIVGRVFNELAGGIGRGTIARRLNEAGIKAFTDKGDGWHGGTVQKLTTSRAVLGEYQPMKLVEEEDSHGVMRMRRQPVGDPIRNYYPQIISDELWLKAQKASKARRCYSEDKVANAGGRIGKNFSNLFREVGKCAECGANMVYKANIRGKPFLFCSREKRKMCDNRTRYYYDQLEDGVLQWVWQLDLSEHVPDAAKAVEKELGTLELTRNNTQEDIDRLLADFVGKKSPSVSALVESKEAEIASLNQKIERLQAQLADIQSQLDYSGRQAALRELREKLVLTGSDAERFRIRAKVSGEINSVVETMKFGEDGEITVKVRNVPIWYIFKDGELSRIRDCVREPFPHEFETALTRTSYLYINPSRPDTDVLEIKPPGYEERLEQVRREMLAERVQEEAKKRGHASR